MFLSRFSNKKFYNVTKLWPIYKTNHNYVKYKNSQKETYGLGDNIEIICYRNAAGLTRQPAGDTLLFGRKGQ
jgi:hypothetical protein